MSVLTGCTNHNIKVPKGKRKVVYERSFERFCQELFCTDANNYSGRTYINKITLMMPLKLLETYLTPVVETPIKRHTVKQKYR